jgi:preprotein translocase subunit SecF
MSKDVPVSKVEEVLVSGGLTIGSAAEPMQANKPAAQEKTPQEGQDSEASEEEAQVDAQRCESATCTWPYRDERIYKVNLKGLAEHVMEKLRSEPFGAGAVKMRSEWVGPKVGERLQVDGTLALVYALLFIMLYISVRFDLRFAPGAVVALIHDVCITMGIFTLVRVEVTLATIAALLTIIGYSLNDTIVVFDRIRENLTKIKESKLSKVVNTSINQTLSRTVLTSLTTLIVVGCILVLGWRTSLRDFAFALLIGVFVGTYSSIFIASPIVVWLDTRFGKKRA